VAFVGWYVRGLGTFAATSVAFVDELANQQMPYLFAKGSWRGGDLANKINTVEITCTPSERRCDLYQADVMALSGWRPSLSLYNKSFRVTKLDAQSVVAEPNLPDLCIRQTLMFDRMAKAVTLVAHQDQQRGRLLHRSERTVHALSGRAALTHAKANV
jgi:hypothetical protein